MEAEQHTDKKTIFDAVKLSGVYFYFINVNLPDYVTRVAVKNVTAIVKLVSYHYYFCKFR